MIVGAYVRKLILSDYVFFIKQSKEKENAR